MGIVLDSTVLIGAERKRLDLSKLLLDQPVTETIMISVVTASELLHGCERAATDAIRKRRTAFVESMLQRLPVVDFRLGEARKHAELWARLETAGTPIGAHDMMIAATCLNVGARLATLNVREFARVKELVLMDVQGYRL